MFKIAIILLGIYTFMRFVDLGLKIYIMYLEYKKKKLIEEANNLIKQTTDKENKE